MEIYKYLESGHAPPWDGGLISRVTHRCWRLRCPVWPAAAVGEHEEEWRQRRDACVETMHKAVQIDWAAAVTVQMGSMD